MDEFVFYMKITAVYRMKKPSGPKHLIFVFLISHLFMRPAANRRKKMHKTRGKNISELTVDIFLPIQYADKRRKNQEIIEKQGKAADIE